MPELLFMFQPGKPTETLYEDGVDYSLFGNAEIVRNSHIEPVKGSTDWMIVWQGEFIELFGKVTMLDERGRRFRSHKAAAECEKRMLLKHHYKVPARSKWVPGDRVTRPVYLDDGTWNREGDSCRDGSPLYRGVVTRRSEDRDDEVFVLWDGTTREKSYLDHGLARE